MTQKANLTCCNHELGVMISRFEMGQLSQEETESFEEHLMDCDYCRTETEQMRPVVAFLRRNRAQIIAQLAAEGLTYDALKAELLAAKHKKGLLSQILDSLRTGLANLMSPKIYVPALAVAGAGLFLLFRPGEPVVSSPYANLLSFEKIPFQQMETRGNYSDDGKRLFGEGMIQYNRNNYEAAIESLKKATKLAPENELYWLYLGVSGYLDHKPQIAISALNRADSLAEPMLKNKTGWYRAQAYLLAGDSSQANPLLDRIIHEQREYAHEAEALLSEVRSTFVPKSKSGG